MKSRRPKIEPEGPDFLAEITLQEPLAIQHLLLKEAIENCEMEFSKRSTNFSFNACKG